MAYDPSILDPAFTDVAARMSAKFDELAVDKVIDVPSKWTGVPSAIGPLKGWAKDPFFEPAIALSGQDRGLVEALYGVIAEVWVQTGEGSEGFQSGMGQVFSKWNGTASIDCATYVGNLTGFVNSEQQCLFTLARGLVTYAAIIEQARKALVDLMGKCVDGWNQAGHTGEAANLSVATAVVTAVSGALFTVVTSGAGAVTLPMFGGAVMAVAGNVTNNAPNLDLAGKSDEIATKFLREAQTLLDQTADTIDREARRDLDQARDSLPVVPPLPGGITDKTKFFPVLGDVGGGQPTQIRKTLG